MPVSSPAKTEAPEHVIDVGGKVQAAKLIRQVQPNYPALARQIRVQGVVTLEAIIGSDGTIQQLRALSGHPLLIPSAVQAVQQWLYSSGWFSTGKPWRSKPRLKFDSRFPRNFV